MNSFTDLLAWQVGFALVKEVYRLTEQFPKSEQFGLTSQLRRASVSILANLAEGFSRRTGADKAHKYTISRGECSETHALLLVSCGLGRLTVSESAQAIAFAEKAGRLISGLIHKHMSASPTPYTLHPTPQ